MLAAHAGWVCWLLAATPSLQALVDAAPRGSVLEPPAGHYLGAVLIDKPLTLDGHGLVVIDGQGKGTVVTLRGGSITLRGVRVTGSGGSHDQLDAAVSVEGDANRVEHDTIDDALFGVLLKGANATVVCGNRITSKADEPEMRGDAVRVWNGRHNRIVGNDITLARDVSLANSPDNAVLGNVISHGRFGLHLVFSPRVVIEGNWLDTNLTGIAVLYSDNAVIRKNRIQHSRGVSGAGLAFKDSSLALVDENAVVHCAVGVKANSPTHPDNVIFFRNNRFAHNVSGMDFYGENGGHLLYGNWFEKNLSQVTVSGPMSARGNDWRGNVWDDYEGFDRDGDGFGDTPFEIYAFTDRIFQETPHATFFRNSPALELLDFLERLAPFAAPELTLRDPRPRTTRRPDTTPATAPAVPFCTGDPT